MRKAAACAFALALAATTASAQQTDSAASSAPPPEGPLCTAGIEGQLSCQANRVCECVFSRAVPARNLPDRWHWDCDIKRPSCHTTPESLAPHDAYDALHDVEVEHIDHDRDRLRDPPDEARDRDPPSRP